MRDLTAELVEVSNTLQKANIPYALVGGLAYSIYVEPRATEDLDFLILPESWEECIPLLKPLGWRDLAGPMDFKKIRIRRLTKISDGSSLVCDFLLADGDFRTGVINCFKIPYHGTSLNIASPEVIIRLKEGRMSEKDRGDIEGLRKLIDGLE